MPDEDQTGKSAGGISAIHSKPRIRHKPVLVSFLMAIVAVAAIFAFHESGGESPPSSVTPPGEPEKRVENRFGMTFVRIPPGTFGMGSPDRESGRFQDEKRHRVTLSKGYYIQTTEVTQGQWKRVMGDNPSRFTECGDNCPVERVSWEMARGFVNTLNQLEKTDKYRLPTEAEWEYACRAGTETAYSYGNKADCRQMMCGNDPGSSDTECVGHIRSRGLTPGSPAPVMSYPANDWGVYDMHGNVWEWCADWYGDYPSGNVTDPTGPAFGEGRVLRGGSWFYYASACRAAARRWNPPDSRYDRVGVRLVTK